MITATVFTDLEHRYTGIELAGHAGYAENGVPQQELVCAAVSALTTNMANSVEQFTDDEFTVDTEEDGGIFRFHFTSDISSESSLLMNSLVFGLQDIEEFYGEPYIKIRFEEV